MISPRLAQSQVSIKHQTLGEPSSKCEDHQPLPALWHCCQNPSLSNEKWDVLPLVWEGLCCLNSSLSVCFPCFSTSHRERSPRPTTKIFISLLCSSYLMVLWLWTTPGIWCSTLQLYPQTTTGSMLITWGQSDIYFRYESAEKSVCTPVGKNPALPLVLCLQVTDCSCFPWGSHGSSRII